MAKSKNALEVLKCPQCDGDIELDEKQQYSFCKYCGTKVQNSNFKVIEGEVRISGNPTVQNFIKLASRDYADGNYSEALENYNRALDIEPDNWEAVYRRGVCITKTTTLAAFRMGDIVKGSKNALKIIENNPKLSKNIDQIKVDMAYDILMSATNMYSFAMKHYYEFSDLESSASEMWNREAAVIDAAQYAATMVENIKDDNIKTSQSNESRKSVLMAAYDIIITCCVEICKIREYKNVDYPTKTWIDDKYRTVYVELYDTCAEKIRQIDPTKVIKPIQRTGKQGGCYVATCVYGSYDCPQVWTLRRYRDNNLAKTWYGRLFIHTYYACSPTIVKLFGKKDWFKRIWKPKLDKMVNKLQKEGFESTPYNDTKW